MRVNEIFYSLQGEGYFTGTPAIFLRLAGCNLSCSFCDTEHEPFTEMNEEEIVCSISSFPASHVVITGGEPTLQLTSSLVDMLHNKGKFVQIETNGTIPLKEDCHIDWVTCSPKRSNISLQHIDELKVIYQDTAQDMDIYANIDAKVYSLQPCDTGDNARNEAILRAAIDYCLAHPKWRLSLQTHKMIDVK